MASLGCKGGCTVDTAENILILVQLDEVLGILHGVEMALEDFGHLGDPHRGMRQLLIAILALSRELLMAEALANFVAVAQFELPQRVVVLGLVVLF